MKPSETPPNPGRTLADLLHENVEAIERLERASQGERCFSDRVADAITRFVGSMPFVYLHIVGFSSWIAINSLPFAQRSWRFDPYPFTFLTLIVSLEAIFLTTFLLISQNHEERVAKRRNQLDLQINLLAEEENSKMLSMLEAIQRKLGIAQNDPELRILEEATSPHQLANQIDAFVRSEEKRGSKSG